MKTRRTGRWLLIAILQSAICILAVGCNIFRPKPEAPDAKVTHTGPVDTSKLTADRMVDDYLTIYRNIVI